MITAFRIRPLDGSEPFVFDLIPSETASQYILLDAKGLDPGAISPIGYGNSTDGVQYTTMQSNERIIDLTIGLNPYATGDFIFNLLRGNLYSAIARGRTPNVYFDVMINETISATVPGLITNVSAPLFTKTPELSLTITCLSPYLEAPEDTMALFELIEPANVRLEETQSSVPTGFELAVDFILASSSWGIRDPDNAWFFNIEHDFIASDDLRISSVADNLSVSVTRSGLTTYIADKVVSGSTWPLIFSGENIFTLMADPALYNLGNVVYRRKFWGL